MYPTDLTDEQWKLVEPLLPPPSPWGRKRTLDLRQVTDALLYLVRTGCQWRMLPKDFPNWNSVRYYFDAWTHNGTLQRINDALREQVRTWGGREPQPSAAIVDSQSVKTTEVGGTRGFDGEKRVNGRKRQILVDTLGLLLRVSVHEADISDAEGGEFVLVDLGTLKKRLRKLWADQAYRGLVDWVKEE